MDNLDQSDLEYDEEEKESELIDEVTTNYKNINDNNEVHPVNENKVEKTFDIEITKKNAQVQRLQNLSEKLILDATKPFREALQRFKSQLDIDKK